MEEALKIVEELQKNENGELSNCWDYGAEAQEAIGKVLEDYKEKSSELYAANQIISEQIDILRNSIDKNDVLEIIEELKIKKDMNMITGADLAISKLQELLEIDYYGGDSWEKIKKMKFLLK